MKPRGIDLGRPVTEEMSPASPFGMSQAFPSVQALRVTVITISRKELSRRQILIGLADGHTRVDAAAALMGMGRRQVYRLLDAFRTHGAEALVSKRRGKPSNRAHGAVYFTSRFRGCDRPISRDWENLSSQRMIRLQLWITLPTPGPAARPAALSWSPGRSHPRSSCASRAAQAMRAAHPAWRHRRVSA